MNRSRAALTHVWPSILMLAPIAGLILFAWYPYPFLQFPNSGKFSLLLILTATLLGPALTWLVYAKGKRSLVFDLGVIVLIQTVAIGWGVYTLYQNRPYFMVYTVDRFEVLSRREVDTSSIADPRLMEKPFTGPVLLYVSMPEDEQSFQKLLHEVVFEGKADLQFRPEFWSLYGDKKQLALQESRPLAELRSARPEYHEAIDDLVKNNGGEFSHLSFVPAKLKNGQFAAILDGNSGDIVDYLIIDPWID